jgi:hypothetical protein
MIDDRLSLIDISNVEFKYFIRSQYFLNIKKFFRRAFFLRSSTIDHQLTWFNSAS